MERQKNLTEAEREAIALKHRRRVLELGIPIFGMPPEDELEEFGGSVAFFPDPNAEARAAGAERGRTKAEEFRQRILDASTRLLQAAPRPDEGRPHHRKPGDLHRTARRLRDHEVDLPDPALDRETEAASFDRYANFEQAKIAFGKEMNAVRNEAAAGLFPMLMTLLRFARDVLHVLKEWAKEDPEGPATAYFRDFNRAWRQSSGRSRGKRRNERRPRLFKTSSRTAAR